MSNEGGKKKKLGCLIGIIVVIVLMIAAVGGGDEDGPKKVGTVDSTKESDEGSNDASGESQNAGAAESATEATTQEVSNEFVVGDIVATDEFKISYISAEEYVEDNEFLQPKEGHVYYRMEFEFENVSNSDQTVSSMLNWNCYADGYAVDQTWIGDDGLDATLSAGKKVKGALYYEIPAEAAEITLEYDVNFYSSDKIIFIVK